MKGQHLLLAMVLGLLLLNAPVANAVNVCVQVSVERKTGNVSTKRQIAARNPKGTTTSEAIPAPLARTDLIACGPLHLWGSRS